MHARARDAIIMHIHQTTTSFLDFILPAPAWTDRSMMGFFCFLSFCFFSFDSIPSLYLFILFSVYSSSQEGRGRALCFVVVSFVHSQVCTATSCSVRECSQTRGHVRCLSLFLQRKVGTRRLVRAFGDWDVCILCKCVPSHTSWKDAWFP